MGVYRGDIAGRAAAQETLAYGLQRGVRAAQAAGRTYRDDRAIGYEFSHSRE